MFDESEPARDVGTGANGAADAGAPMPGDPTPSAEHAPAVPDALATAQAEAARYLANWQRAQADLINYRRRAEQDKEEATKFGSLQLLKALLPIFDDLERAIANAPAEITQTVWFEGLQLLGRKIESTLHSQGVETIAAEGEHFDPTMHEAVLYEAGEEGQVTAEFQRGYRLHGRVVRPSLVRVGSGGSSGDAAAPG